MTAPTPAATTDPATPPADGTPPATTPPTPATVAAATATPKATEPTTTDPAPSKWDELFKGKTPEQIKAQVDEATKWENRSKGNKKQLEAFFAALGVEDPKAADPNQIATDLATERGEKRSVKVELAVLRTAIRPDIGANADALLDSRSFMESVATLDPADAGFAKAVEKAVTDAVTNNPALKTAGTQLPSSSGPEVTGDRNQTPLAEQLAAARKAGNIPLAIQIQQQMKLGNRT